MNPEDSWAQLQRSLPSGWQLSQLSLDQRSVQWALYAYSGNRPGIWAVGSTEEQTIQEMGRLAGLEAERRRLRNRLPALGCAMTTGALAGLIAGPLVAFFGITMLQQIGLWSTGEEWQIGALIMSILVGAPGGALVGGLVGLVIVLRYA